MDGADKSKSNVNGASQNQIPTDEDAEVKRAVL